VSFINKHGTFNGKDGKAGLSVTVTKFHSLIHTRGTIGAAAAVHRQEHHVDGPAPSACTPR